MALKILLADKNTTAQKLGQKILTDAGHQVITVSNGAAAVKRIAEHKPDLLVLDAFMPGYSGTEVCAKVRSGAEGANVPVLLTVAQMEHFDPAEAEKVKADGVIVKPFVAKDLEELVAKLEQKLKAPPAAQSYQATQKIQAPEFQDASYEEWKVTAEDHVEEEAPAEAKLEVPKEMASSAAFGDLLGEEPAHVSEAAPPPAMEAQPTVELEPAAAMAPAPAAPSHEIEFTSAPKAEVRVERAPELEPTIRAAEEIPHTGGMDPALITDATEMASAFPTKFGVEGAEVVPVGVAADMPELYADAQAPVGAAAEAPAEELPAESERITQEFSAPAPAEPVVEAAPAEPKRITQEISAPAPEAAPGWSAQAEAMARAEASPSLEQEMAQAFGDLPVEAAPPAEEPPPPPVEAAPPPAAPANAPDAVLAAAMQAAVAGPAASVTLDANTIANIVQRVTDRMKPELISEIARELAAEAERTRKP